MSTASVYTVIPFVEGKGKDKGKVIADKFRAKSFDFKHDALRVAERVAANVTGAVVIEAMVDRDTGESDEAKLVRSYGKAPTSLDEF